MRTVLFVFCFNSLGIVLVLTETRQPLLTDVGCKMTMTGHEYAGPLSVTRSGLTCQRWDSDQPHTNGYKDPKLYPDGSLAAAGNKCRNPDKDNGGVWCYTNDPNTAWEHCNVDLCDVGCKMTLTGHEYAGPLNATKSGRTCQRWDSDRPHTHRFKDPKLYPDESLAAAGNKCRNPDKNKGGVWCFTNDPNTAWEYCNVDLCVLVCKLTRAGHEYKGLLNVTRSGRTCQAWDSDEPHKNRYKQSNLFPERSAWVAGNKCRNPDAYYDEGVWCYTTDPNTRWEKCDVDFCDCKLTKAGHEYAGPLNVTRSGRTCQRWVSDEPHYSNFGYSMPFPERNVVDVGNKCRNPDEDYDGGVWCYTTDPNKRWEECDVDLCQTPGMSPSPTSPKITRPSPTRHKITPASTTNPKTTRPSTTNPKTTRPSTTNPKTTPASTKNLMTIRSRTTPDTTSPPSTDVSTRSPITLSSTLPQANGSRDAVSTHIVVFGILIAGVIAVVCVIVVIIIIRKRADFFQSPCSCLADEDIPPRSKRNQQKSMAAKAMYKPSENPDDVNCQLQLEMPL